MMRELPVFRGYTVDVRLRQFRKADAVKRMIEFVDFESEQGEELLSAYVDTLDADSEDGKETLAQILR